MLRAGVRAWNFSDLRFESEEAVVESIFTAMMEAVDPPGSE
jgi:hypothetical protein